MNRLTNLAGEGNANLEEAWWASLLSDEERSVSSSVGKSSIEHFLDHKESAVSVVNHQPNVDWGRVQVLYEADETIELTIVGYNRGGLLAEDKGI